jgi:fucose 4-O-acetylase-like acetyltransferase
MTPVVVLLMGIAFVKFVPSLVWEIVRIIGDISLYILIVHPIIREVTLPLSTSWGYWSLIAYVTVTLTISLIVAKLVRRE